jgi:putative ABC transport system permease protein
VRIVTEEHDGAFQAEVAESAQERLEAASVGVRSIQTAAMLRQQATAYFNIILFFLMARAVLLATVGGLGLIGTMSINVVGRIREIGVMRAIGARSSAIHQVFLVEGVLIGILSWLVGSLFAFPVGKWLSDEVGLRFIQSPPHYRFSMTGVFIWFVLIILLSALATWLPAQNAVRLRVREILSYE